MHENTRVLGTPPAEPRDALRHFRDIRLACETDPYDVHCDLAAGAAGFVLLDSRRRTDHDRCHIPGARSFAHQEMTDAALAALPKDTVYVTYGWGPGCNAGTRAAARLAEHGFRVKEMIGGLEYWQRAGYETACAPSPAPAQ
ncbi:rhodanese-like domain-containing protein [Streptomyces bathyalis]|uniref:Rhodanese-like domain-containing protein n=1 Tax=Streptomyces bathyalis TaxID=2710756 RepID=A0A7T1WUX8_9ACTN|nr:rhodanese-like domain-containing protein [Streptomyces bathyalis]QPP08380.1 rhodanese-like domain-containing protein [Streptomyces bathyalis]